jgi:hypothetical protein
VCCDVLRGRVSLARVSCSVNEERFWAKVDKQDTCWVWTASCNPKGYGQFLVNKVPRRAHRLSWEMHNGPIPAGMQVLHRCDNPSCVRPEHLFLGTNNDNMQDKITKGRGRAARHEKQGKARLTTRQVVEIRCLRGVISQLSIANIYDISSTAVHYIVADKTWRPS